jgi:23S rRNA (adenine2503-C2)-methyltransferase
MIPLQALTPKDLRDCVPGMSIEEARKIVGAVHRRDMLPETVKMVRRTTMDAVRRTATLPRLTFLSAHHSSLDPFVKYACATPDGHVIEMVRIPLERAGRYSVCISSQAGCGFACAFCATGQGGMSRNLETWEIVEQVLTVRRDLDKSKHQRVHGIVFQGMGEPLANLKHVLQAIRVICEPSGLAVDGRTVTVCTAGIPRGIRELAREAPKARLAISIGSARSEVRSALMPIEHRHPLSRVLEAAADHARVTGLAPMWAITPLAGINDTEEDAVALAALAREFSSRSGLQPQISIISYNPTAPPDQDRFQKSGEERESAFRDALRREGFFSRKRYSGGADIFAACGQLAARGRKSPPETK